jgi:mannose-6-phosphate isomerase-like protein (cupin superfamily)
MKPRILFHDPAGEYWFEEGCFVSELLNDADDAALSIARIRVPVGGTTHWHRLAGIAERYVIQSGHGRVEVGEQSPQDVAAGDVVVIPPGVRQRIANTGDDELVFLAICTPRFVPAAYTVLD